MSLLRRVMPAPLVQAYHFCLAHVAAALFGYPSREMTVIGITGTNGKSSTVAFLSHLLEHAGYRVGFTSTAGFRVAGVDEVNSAKMTMLGRFATQAFLRRMCRAGCTHAIIETSSQGIVQFRHVGIAYDAAVFTNLTPEHIEAHGGFEKYRAAKGKLFSHTAASPKKSFPGAPQGKIAVVNVDDPASGYFLSFGLPRQYGWTLRKPSEHPELAKLPCELFEVEDFICDARGSHWRLGGVSMSIPLIGRFQALNAISAAVTAHALGLSWQQISEVLECLPPVPGRLEEIKAGQSFRVFVDYAYEPAALGALYEALELVPHARLIHVTGSAGGGRDEARRAQIGVLAAQKDSITIVTNEDPYDEDPWDIINAVADAAVAAGMREGETLFRMLDRREALAKACALAGPDDLVVVTGKGNEPVMAVAQGKKIPWDDRAVLREILSFSLPLPSGG